MKRRVCLALGSFSLARIVLAVMLVLIIGKVDAQDAQDFPSLRQRAEDAVKSMRPDWTLVRKDEKPKQVIYQYGTVSDGVNLSIFYGSSQEEAAVKMKSALKFLSVGPGKKITTLGDEAYLWQSERGPFAGIRFRKSNVYIDLVAPSIDVAENLAKGLAQFIQKK